MSEKYQKIIGISLLVLAIVLGFTGSYILALWQRALNAEIYVEALDQSGVYTEVTNVIEAQVTYYLKTEGKLLVETLAEEQLREDEDENRIINKALLIWLLNSVIDNRTETAVSRVSQRIGLEASLKTYSETAITNTLDWVRGDVEDPQIFALIPSVEELENREKFNLRAFLLDFVYDTLGFNDLPECPDSDSARDALRQISEGQWLGIACVSEKIRPAVVERIGESIPENALADVEQTIQESNAKYRLDTLTDGLNEFVLQLSKLKEQILNVRHMMESLRVGAIVLILLSLLSALGAFFVYPRRNFRVFAVIGLGIGLSLTIVGVILDLVLRNEITNAYDLSEIDISSEAISVAQSALLADSLYQMVFYIGDHVNDYAIQAGLIITALFLLILVVLFIANGGKDKIIKFHDNFGTQKLTKNRK